MSQRRPRVLLSPYVASTGYHYNILPSKKYYVEYERYHNLSDFDFFPSRNFYLLCNTRGWLGVIINKLVKLINNIIVTLNNDDFRRYIYITSVLKSSFDKVKKFHIRLRWYWKLGFHVDYIKMDVKNVIVFYNDYIHNQT